MNLSAINKKYATSCPTTTVRLPLICVPHQGPLRFCVVGSGPAGFYTADKLLNKLGDQEAVVDILVLSPLPFIPLVSYKEIIDASATI